MTTSPPEPGPEGDPAAPDATSSGVGGVVDAEAAVLADAAAVVDDVVEREFGPEGEAAMDSLDVPRRLLLVHAHPDDETLATGATMARYAATGTQVTLVTCTLGEEGEVIPAELSHLAADAPALAEHRRGELATAMEALGVTDHRLLADGRWRDSGMVGTDSVAHPDAFANADVGTAAAVLSQVIREVRPQVVIGYDPDGGYGHPDHVQAHHVTMSALELAAADDDPWDVAKVYWIAVPRSVAGARDARVRAAADAGEHGYTVPDPDRTPDAVVVDDAEIAAVVDGTAHREAVLAALRAHATQIEVTAGVLALSNGIGREVQLVDHYRLVRGDRAAPLDDEGRENDLFNGIA